MINAPENVGNGRRVCVGSSVGVSMGTSDVAVGVNVTGVAVETANRSFVGYGVALDGGVGVSANVGVGVIRSAVISGRLAQPTSNMAKRSIGKSFFITNPIVSL